MQIAFISNFINHHQVHVADELYKLVGDGYRFIETEPMPEDFVKAGYPDFSDRPYVIKAYESAQTHESALDYVYNADVAVIGSSPEYYVTNRIKASKLTFRYSERWFKSRPWYLTGVKGWINIYKDHIRYRRSPLYMLCASAFTAKDVNTVGAYKNKCFKWGYFTKLETDGHKVHVPDNEIHIMWCARFINLKHPELPVMLAERLKKRGYDFLIEMYGSGVELERIKSLANYLNVDDVVKFCGNLPNDKILEQMRKADIFLFTSDKNEGWGAVLNEAMSSGCAVVGSDQIGSVPFLIEDGVNGCIFKSEDLDSLEEKVCSLIDDNSLRLQIAQRAYQTIKEVWSPQNAAKQFLNLIQAIESDNEEMIPHSGPCSRA